MTTEIRATASNLRFAYSTTPADGGGFFTTPPEVPARAMSVKAVEEAIEAAARNVSGGTYYTARLWVGDRIVTRFQGCGARTLADIRFILNCVRDGGAEVETESRW
jgi:hypothetical protein